MLFSSLQFLFLFLPLTLCFYYAAPAKARNWVLLLASLVFYAWGGVSYALVLVASICINFFFAGRIRSAAQSKKWLHAGLAVNIAALLVFKYFNFFVGNINGGLAAFFNAPPLPYLKIAMPLGISFFTFHQMSMLWDVYREEKKPVLSLPDTFLYISFFPQLIAGPIVRYHDIIDQIKQRQETIELFSSGIRRFVLGLFKKVVLANTCAVIADEIMDKDIALLSSSAAWLGIVAYSLQIYFDFSGYSDMGIGLARMFGFRLLENFNFPYISRSIKEFWRRWHISLSTWFRDYVFIPLGGSRQGVKRTYINLMIVFLLTGFWHGASWSFVFWGVFHGFFLVVEKLGWDRVLAKIPKPLAWAYTMLVVMVGWVFFRIADFGQAWQYVSCLFGFREQGSMVAARFLDQEKIGILLLALLSCSTLFARVVGWYRSTNSRWQFSFRLGESVAVLCCFFYAVLILVAGSYNPFIYFRF